MAAQRRRAIGLIMAATERDFAARRPGPVRHPAIELGLRVEPATQTGIGAAQHDGVRSDGMRLEPGEPRRSEEHTSELQSLMRISYSVFCLKTTTQTPIN